jgi:hypothetical protein
LLSPKSAILAPPLPSTSTPLLLRSPWTTCDACKILTPSASSAAMRRRDARECVITNEDTLFVRTLLIEVWNRLRPQVLRCLRAAVSVACGCYDADASDQTRSLRRRESTRFIITVAIIKAVAVVETPPAGTSLQV